MNTPYPTMKDQTVTPPAAVHSPLPWSLNISEHESDSPLVRIASGKETGSEPKTRRIGDLRGMSKEDREHIVRSVNLLPEVLKVLEEINHYWETDGDAKSRYAHKVRAILSKAKQG